MSSNHSESDGIRPPLTDADIERLRKPLQSMAGRHTPDRSLRDDLVQEALLALVDDGGWTDFRKVARRAMRRFMREELRRRMASLEDGPVPLSSDSPIWDELGSIGLSDAHRTAAVLYWSEGRSQTDIASATGSTQATVSKLLKEVERAVWEQWVDDSEGGGEQIG